MNYINRMKIHKSLFREVYLNAKKIFWISLWAKKDICRLLSDSSVINNEYSILFPNICNVKLDYKIKSKEVRSDFITVISYHQYKRKGLEELIESFSEINAKGRCLNLNVYGTGTEYYKKEIKNLIEKYYASSFVHLMGQVSQAKLFEIMSVSKGFLMPSIDETFGMAYVEAISVGCPILYVCNTGIDGYFEGRCVGVKIDKVNSKELTNAILEIDNNQARFISDVSDAIAENYLEIFTSHYLTRLYLKEVKNVIGA